MCAVGFRLWCVETNTGIKPEAAGLQSLDWARERAGGVGTAPRDTQWGYDDNKERPGEPNNASNLHPSISGLL